MKTYIVHYDKLTERKKFMDYQLQLNNLNYEYVSNYGRDKLTMLDKNKFRNIIRHNRVLFYLKYRNC